MNNRIKLGLFIAASLLPAYAFFQLASLNTLSTSLLKLGNDSFISNLSTTYLLVDAIFLIPAGILLDHIHLKKLMPIALSILLIGVLISSFADTKTLFYIGRIITGIGHSFSFLIGLKIIRGCFSNSKYLSTAISLMLTTAMLGGFMAQSPLAYLANHVGIHIALRIDFGLGILLLFYVVFILQFFQDNLSSNQQYHLSLTQQLISVIKVPQNIPLGALIGILSAPLLLIGSTWGAQYLIHINKFSSQEAEFLSSIIFIGTIIGMPCFGWLADRFGALKKLILIGMILAIITSILFLTLHAKIMALQSSILFFLAFAGGAQSLGYALITQSNHSHLQNTAMALANVVIMLVGAAFPFIFELISKLYPENNTAALWHGMLVMPAAFITGLLLLLIIKKQPRLPKA